MNKDIINKMKEQFNGCPLFIDREKGDLDELVGKKVVIESYYKLTGENGDYYALAFKGFDDKFYLSGGALTELINGYGDEAKCVEILIKEKIKTKSKREYRPINIFELK